MLIFFMPDWMLDVKPNCNGILQPLRKVIMLQWKFIWMFGGLSDQDLSSTYHWVGQLSAFLRAKNGTGSSIQVWALSLIFISHWCPERLRRTVTRESSTASPGLHWTETCHSCQIFMCSLTSSRLLAVSQGCVSRTDTFKECLCDPSIFFSFVPTAWICFRWCGYQIQAAWIPKSQLGSRLPWRAVVLKCISWR